MRLALKIAVSVALLSAIIWYLGGVEEVGALLLGAAPFYLLLAFLVMTADRWLMTYKWGLLLRARGAHLPLFEGLQVYCAAMMWGMFLRATVGADALRGYFTCRAGLDSNEVFASIIVERIFGFAVSLVFGLVAFAILDSTGIIDHRFASVWRAGAALVLVASVATLMSFSERLFNLVLSAVPVRFREAGILQKFRRFHTVYCGYGANKRAIAVFVALSFAEQFAIILYAWVIALALHVQVGLLFVTGIVPLMMLIARLPIAFDGLGSYEGTFILLMGLGGVEPSEAVSIALCGRLIQMLAWAPWWLLHSLGTRRMRPPVGLAKERG